MGRAVSAADPVARGGCQCGRHRYALGAEPFAVSYCHCNDCRRATGAPVTVFAGVRDDEVTFGEAPAVFASSDQAERLFCSACGTPLAYRDRRLPGELYLLLGTLDEPGRFVPQRHAFTARQLPWLHIDDGLPRHPGFSRSRPDDAGDPPA